MARLTKAQWAVGILCWLAVWEIAARQVKLSFALPTVEDTMTALWQLLRDPGTLTIVGCSLGRILLGLGLGVLLSLPLTWLSVRSGWAKGIIAPMMTVVRCTPVASFIMLLWVLLGRDALPQVIALLMVLPVMWQALTEACGKLDTGLDEVLTVFRAGRLRRFRLLVVPGLKLPFLTALSTAAGLAWKSGVAAQIITYTSRSIGRQIADARTGFDGAAMMAWTLLVVVLSLLIDRLLRLPVRLLRSQEAPHA